MNRMTDIIDGVMLFLFDRLKPNLYYFNISLLFSLIILNQPINIHIKLILILLCKIIYDRFGGIKIKKMGLVNVLNEDQTITIRCMKCWGEETNSKEDKNIGSLPISKKLQTNYQ